jgi:AmmeMemoRadiSam system protein A
VFVTLRTRDGALRGCVGHLEPGYATLADEIAACAVACATRDTRFSPVGEGELSELDLEISLLSAAEPVRSANELDPDRYGVVVSAGERRGVLLPNVDGVRNAHDQVRLAATKAGIAADAEDVALARFEVIKLKDRAVAPPASRPSALPKARYELN